MELQISEGSEEICWKSSKLMILFNQEFDTTG